MAVGRDVPVRVALTALPAYGHLFPMLPLAEALDRAGADLVIDVGEPLLGSLPYPRDG